MDSWSDPQVQREWLAAACCEHLDRLYAYAYRLTGAHDRAEDLTQQTFLVAQQRLDQLRDPDRGDSWLLSILRNLFLKNCRRRLPVPASQLQLEVDDLHASPSSESEFDDERIQQVLNRLADEYRVVVLMYYFEGLSYREVSAELKLPCGTVMSRLARAKTQLRRMLGTRERAVS